MGRSRDEVIPANEPMYRSISREDVREVDGKLDILPDAVDLPRCSFNRSAYSEPEDVFTERRPGDTGIVQIAPRDLPGPVPRAPGAPYEFFAHDDPNPPEDEANDAHREVRIRPQGLEFSPNYRPKKPILAKAKEALARALHVHTPPR